MSMENWYLILIDLGVLLVLGGLFYLAQKKLTLRKAKKGVLFIIHDILKDLGSDQKMPETIAREDLIKAKEIMQALSREKVIEADYDYDFIMTELEYLIRN